MTEIIDLGKYELREEWLKTVDLRNNVLEWAKRTGFNANELVSRTAEHQIEMFFGRQRLQSND